MRNFFLSLVAFPFFSILTACGALIGNQGADSCEGQEPSLETWQGLQFEMNPCWTQVQVDEDLILVSEDKANSVTFTQKGPDTVGIRSELKSVENNEGLNFFIVLGDSLDSETLEIADSVQAEIYEIAASSCEAPDSTYAYSMQETWRTLTYDLIFCWGAKEITTSENSTALLLEKGDGSAWVQITLMSGIPSTEKTTPLVTQNEDGTTTYVYEDYFTAITDAPDDNNVQDILYSLSRANLTDEALPL